MNSFTLTVAALVLPWPIVTTIRFIVAGKGRRLSILQSWYIKCTWKRVALPLGLTMLVQKPRSRGEASRARDAHDKFPRLSIRTDQFGCIVKVKTLPTVGPEQWNKVDANLADAWKCVRISVEHPKPSRVLVRALHTDPLTTTVEYKHDPNPPDNFAYVTVGVDQWGKPVRIRLRQSSGVSAYGVPGSGKTSLAQTVVCTLAPSPAVQFILADGKPDRAEDGDWRDALPRCSAWIGDNPEEYLELIKRVDQLRKWRMANAYDQLGRRGLWLPDGTGPSQVWPLVIVIVDECQTYFEGPKGDDKESKRLRAVCAENVRITTNVVKKSRSQGVLLFPITQKGTVDAMPSAIRDQITTSTCFAVKTREAAVAALGQGISEYPDADPVGLQGEDYIGCCAVDDADTVGFVRHRITFAEHQLARIAEETAEHSNRNLLPQLEEEPHLTAVA